MATPLNYHGISQSLDAPAHSVARLDALSELKSTSAEESPGKKLSKLREHFTQRSREGFTKA